MVWRYDVIRSNWQAIFERMHVFAPYSSIKVNIVDKMMQSAYLCVILYVTRKKLPFLAALTWFLILGKIQDGGQDGSHCWWRQRPPVASPLLSCCEDQRLSTEGKTVSKLCNTSKKSRVGFHQPPSPPPPHHARVSLTMGNPLLHFRPRLVKRWISSIHRIDHYIANKY